MKKLVLLIPLLFTVIIFFRPFILQSKLPIPSDTIVGLYHPFRDLYSKENPRGIPFKNFLITDPVRQQYPWRWISVEIEKRGYFPLWNPYTMAGAPLLASMQPASLYPLNILFFLMPFSLAWSILIFLEMILAGIFLFIYLDSLKLNRVASLFGSLTFALCGFFIAWLEWGTILHVALWLPLVLLSIDKIVRDIIPLSNNFKFKTYFIWSLTFVFSLTFSFFAGHLQTFFYLFLFSLLYILARWAQFGRQKNIPIVFLLLIFCFLLITAIQWIPTLQLVLSSARSLDQINWQKEGWFIPWQNLIQFIAPDFFGNPTTLNYWGVWNYGEFIGYIGILPLIMAIFALFNRRDKKTFFFGSIFFISLIFSLPTIFAKLPYLYQVSFISTSQPTRLLFLTDFSLVALSAFGLDFYIRSEKKRKIIPSLSFIGIVLLLLWIFVFSGHKLVSTISEEDILVAKRNLYFPTILFAMITILFTITTFIKKTKIKYILYCILLLVTVVDLLRFSQKFTPFTDKKYLFPKTQALTFLMRQEGQFRIMTTENQILPPNFSIIYRLQSIEGYDPLYLSRYGEFIAAIERDKPDIHAPFGFNRIITPHNINSRLVDLLGVKYILSLSEIKNPKLEKVFTEGQTKIYKNKESFPRVFFVKEVKLVADKKTAITALFDQKLDLKKVAIVEDWDRGDQNTAFSNGSVTVKEYIENQVSVNTKNKEQSFLVLTDTFYPTWHAKICSLDNLNCDQTKIYRTDYNFRGVIVPAGEHNVVFYETLL